MSEQGDLFFHAISKAREARDKGMKQVLKNAENKGWNGDEAERFIIHRLSQPGYIGETGETIVNAAKQVGIIPHNDKAFGPIFSRLVRRGTIKKDGYRPRTKGHAAPGAVIWVLG